MLASVTGFPLVRVPAAGVLGVLGASGFSGSTGVVAPGLAVWQISQSLPWIDTQAQTTSPVLGSTGVSVSGLVIFPSELPVYCIMR